MRARLLNAILVAPAVSVVSLSRAARVWPSRAEFFLATEHDLGRLKIIGTTSPDRRGRMFDCFAIAHEAARYVFEKEHREFVLRSWGSLVDSEVHDDLLEPPQWAQHVLMLAERFRHCPHDRRMQMFAEIDEVYHSGVRSVDKVYDDSGRGDRLCALFRRLACATYTLVRAEMNGLHAQAPELFREFAHIAGELLLLGDWHARYVATLAQCWRESPLYTFMHNGSET